MNIETRRFIWGLIQLFLGLIGILCSGLNVLLYGANVYLHIFMSIVGFLVAFRGMILIERTTK